MATDFNITNSENFVNSDPTKTLYDVLLEGIGTKDHYDFETGVKYQTKVPRVSNVDVSIQAGAISGYATDSNASGQTTIQDITLSNVPLNIREIYKKGTIDKKVAGLLEPGSDSEKLPLRDIIVELKGKALFAANEKLIWQDAAATGKFDGILTQLVSGATKTGVSGVSFSTKTDVEILAYVKTIVNKMESTKPEFVTIDTIMSMSPANFAAYSRALYALNGTVTKDTVGADGKPIQELMIPGTLVKAVSEIGLNGSNSIVLTPTTNIIVNYDLVSEDETLEMLYNPFAHWYELTANYKLGVKVVDKSDAIINLA